MQCIKFEKARHKLLIYQFNIQKQYFYCYTSLTIKMHAQYHSPITVIKDYVRQTRASVSEFLKQYLKNQGKYKLKVFNRYMIIAMILNVDLKLLALILLVVYIVVKLMKIKPWRKQQIDSLPLSFVKKKNKIRKKQTKQKYPNVQQQCITNTKLSENPPEMLKENVTSVPQKPCQSLQNGRISLSLNKQKEGERCHDRLSSLSTQFIEESSKMVLKYSADHIQVQMYELINLCLQGFCKYVWYLKERSVLILYILTFIVYLFQPSYKSFDAFHIIAKEKDGELQIESIRRASQYVNQFYLITIWIMTNIVIFYKYGTLQLKQQLCQEIFSREYHQSNAKRLRMKVNRMFTQNNDCSTLTELKSQFKAIPKNYQSMTLRRKHSEGNSSSINIHNLKLFGNDNKQSSEQSQEMQLKPQLSTEHFKQQATKESSLLQDSMRAQPDSAKLQLVESGSDVSDKHIEKEKFGKQIHYFRKHDGIQKENLVSKYAQQNQVGKQNDIEDLKQIQLQESNKPIINFALNYQPKRKLLRKGTFLSSNTPSQNLLHSKSRKLSQEIKIKQKHEDFKINIFKVENGMEKSVEDKRNNSERQQKKQGKSDFHLSTIQ